MPETRGPTAHLYGQAQGKLSWDEGIRAFVPGRAFFADGSNGNTARLSFSCATEAQIDEGIARLGRLIRAA